MYPLRVVGLGARSGRFYPLWVVASPACLASGAGLARRGYICPSFRARGGVEAIYAGSFAGGIILFTMKPPKLLQDLHQLQQQQCALEQEWRDLESREHRAKLKGDKEAVIELMIRRHQIPWEWVDTLQRRAEAAQAFLQQQDSQLEAQASKLRARLVQATELLETTYHEVEQLQQQYGRIQGHLEQELPYYELQRSTYGMRFLYDSVNRRAKRDELAVAQACITECAHLKEAIESDESALERVYPFIEGRELPSWVRSYLSLEKRVIRLLESESS